MRRDVFQAITEQYHKFWERKVDALETYLAKPQNKTPYIDNMENTELTITRVLDAPRELVWKAWTEQKHIEKWWGPKDFTNPVCNWNAKAGSKIYIEMKAPDGVLYPMDGEFSEIKLHEKIVFSAGALDKSGKRFFDIQNTIHFMKEGNKTKLTLHFEMSNITAEAAPFLKGQEMGWNMSLDKLATLLNKLKQ